MNRCVIPWACCVLLIGCVQPSQSDAPDFVVTIHPLQAIVNELVDDHARVHRLLQPGQSPHTYEPRPSDARATERAIALLYVDDHLDGWAAALPATYRIAVFDDVPPSFRLPADDLAHDDHNHGVHDPHFWLDPLTVEAALPALTARLAEAGPDAADDFRMHAEAFGARLRALHGDLEAILEHASGKSVLLVHPSMKYMFERYGIHIAGYIEPLPGKEPGPRYVAELIERAKAGGVAAVFSEVQLSQGAARTIAEAAGVPIAELDPIGGAPGRETYTQLLLFNARVVAETLQ